MEADLRRWSCHCGPNQPRQLGSEVPQDRDVQQAQSAAGAERGRRLSVMCPCGIRLEGECVEVGTVLGCPCGRAVRVAAPSGSSVAV